VSPELIGAKVRRISVADMRVLSSQAWMAMLRWLSVVFMIGAMQSRPCAAAAAGESVVRFFSQEMRQIEVGSVEF
jgi:hypothetical protein